MGTETWLTPSICSAEIFPSNYEVLRKDRKDGHGGVLLAIKKDLIIDTVDINTSTEAVFAKLQMGKNVSLFIGALYRSPSSDIEYMNQLCDTIEHLYQNNKNAVFWIGGDLNLPDINWESLSIEKNQVKSAINMRFLDLIQNCGFEQSVNSQRVLIISWIYSLQTALRSLTDVHLYQAYRTTMQCSSTLTQR